MHGQRRRPHDAEARHQAWYMWTDDRLDHDVTEENEEQKAEVASPTLVESYDSTVPTARKLRGGHRKRRDATP